MTSTVRIPVGGMTCAACQASIQKALEQEPGVASASVSLMLGSASVAYDPQATSPVALVEAIRRTGYEADLPATQETPFEEQERREAAQLREAADLRRRAIFSLIAGGVAMVLSMPLMTAHRGDHGAAIDPFMRARDGPCVAGPREAPCPGSTASTPASSPGSCWLLPSS